LVTWACPPCYLDLPADHKGQSLHAGSLPFLKRNVGSQQPLPGVGIGLGVVYCVACGQDSLNGHGIIFNIVILQGRTDYKAFFVSLFFWQYWNFECRA
jgi:hypothetical protein